MLRVNRRVLFRGAAIPLLLAGFGLLAITEYSLAQTANGEIEGRAAPVARRKCLGGANAGNFCRADADCPGSTCFSRNVYNISVAVQFNATAAELTVIKNALSGLSAVLFDVTDGQAEIGQATIHNDAFGTAADIRIYLPNAGACVVGNRVWWSADTGMWKTGGSIHISYNCIAAAADAGESFAHEFVHLVFDARDEYEARAAGCGPVTGAAHCPDAAAQAAGQNGSLMDVGGLNAGDPGTELCWGHGNPGNLTDVTGGNHDATLVTEQSRCRSDRSVWDQVAWSWPVTIAPPAAAPDPAAGGATVNATKFIDVNDTVRVVLVLDQSGSMGLETPTRLEHLKVAANDFVTLADNGTELGIVSYSSDADPATGHASVAIAALGAARNAWTNAVNALTPTTRTNIGDGLQKARDMITAAGGVTANTFIVLMTDGINNEPWPDPATFLQNKLNDLLAARIPVYVTCTGSDLGLDSQCSEIATATNGFYVDSADSARLPEAFVDLHERTQRRESIGSVSGRLSEAKEKIVRVEAGSDSVTFALMWDNPKAEADFTVVDPLGTVHRSLSMPRGRYVRVSNPTAGEWRMVIRAGNVDSPYVARAYLKNRTAQLEAAVRHASVLPGQDIYVYAYPRYSGPLSHPKETIVARVLRPDGKIDRLELHDQGRMALGGGDDVPDDGIFTGVYRATGLKGSYTFLLDADMNQWIRYADTPRGKGTLDFRAPRFVREVRLSTAVGDPRDIKPEPPPTTPPPRDWCQYLVWLLAVLLLLILYLWWRSGRRRTAGA